MGCEIYPSAPASRKRGRILLTPGARDSDTFRSLHRPHSIRRSPERKSSMFRCFATRIALALAVLCAWLAGTAVAATAPKTNLLANPGFESTLAGHPWMAAAWDTSDFNLPTVFY